MLNIESARAGFVAAARHGALQRDAVDGVSSDLDKLKYC